MTAVIGWTAGILAALAAAGLGLVLWQQQRGTCCPHDEAGEPS